MWRLKSVKTIQELNVIKDKVKNNDSSKKIKIVVGMATCGIAAGAKPVMAAFTDEVKKQGLDVIVSQTGCIGMCKLEPMVDVIMPNGEKVTYIKMTPEKAVQVINDHIVNNKAVDDFTIGSVEK